MLIACILGGQNSGVLGPPECPLTRVGVWDDVVVDFQLFQKGERDALLDVYVFPKEASERG